MAFFQAFFQAFFEETERETFFKRGVFLGQGKAAKAPGPACGLVVHGLRVGGRMAEQARGMYGCDG